jgi:hypothetical protein
MEGAVFCGLAVLAYAIGSGLQAIANAISSRRVDVNFTGPVRVEYERGE